GRRRPPPGATRPNGGVYRERRTARLGARAVRRKAGLLSRSRDFAAASGCASLGGAQGRVLFFRQLAVGVGIGRVEAFLGEVGPDGLRLGQAYAAAGVGISRRKIGGSRVLSERRSRKAEYDKRGQNDLFHGSRLRLLGGWRPGL